MAVLSGIRKPGNEQSIKEHSVYCRTPLIMVLGDAPDNGITSWFCIEQIGIPTTVMGIRENLTPQDVIG